MGFSQVSSRRSGYSTSALAGACAASLTAGFLLCYQFALPAALPPAVPLSKGMLRRSALEATPKKALLKDEADGTAPKVVTAPQQTQKFTSYEEAVHASGLLARRPAAATGETGLDSYVVQPMQLLSLYPRAYLYPGFIDDERCEHIVRLAEARLHPSGLALKKGDTLESQRDVRTSQGTFVSRHDDPDGVLAWVEEKIAQLTGIPAGHGEAFNVLRYENGQHYNSHYDVFEESSYGPQPSQRMVTVLFYLSDVEEGGETVFPLEGENGIDRLQDPNFSYRKCDMGLTVKPRKGDALLFYSLHVNGTFDKHALHGGCPVRKGIKWVATKWIRDKCFRGRGC